MSRPERPIVLHSINSPDGFECVDIIATPEGRCRYQQFRRDPEDPSGWFPLGPASATFDNRAAAVQTATAHIKWRLAYELARRR